ncbi:GerMN domain-containing protein [Paenibacillus sp. MER TA 81-3]|uniref:GerMN domain-containing protein n=1 Tax=Paenibacillus sp. MER TA 81-3 TaxID=2939573 RepID=UPI002041CB17|nr:GerMN domain-containing protein [Paenibacillus sp. MER TA 81-3]MCM3339080.1 GerMN domain-containing protein [Paenibacillus sp. MER TA 81-3]
MMRTRGLRQGALAVVLTLPFLLSACGGSDGAIDQPPADVEAQMLASTEAKTSLLGTSPSLQDEAQLNANMTVFVQDRHGYLAPISYQWDADNTKSLAQASMELLVEGGMHKDKLPSGFTATLPKGTTVTNLTLKPDQKLAIVELSKQFASYEPAQERKILESITWTLTSLPDIENVQLWMDSQKLNEMPVDGMPLDVPLNRQFGINVEKPDTVNYLHSMPVTLYFSSYSEDGKSYFVPVTRLIEPSDDPIQAALEQMIEGPLDKKAMAMTITKETKINEIVRSGDTLTVDLADSMFAEGDPIPAELVKAVVLSMTEQKGIAKVQVKMNGIADIQGTDKKDYSEPVARPVVNLAWKG